MSTGSLACLAGLALTHATVLHAQSAARRDSAGIRVIEVGAELDQQAAELRALLSG